MKKTAKKQKSHVAVFGIHPVLELLRAKKRKIVHLYTTKPEPQQWQTIEKLLPAHTQVQYVKREILAKLAGTPDHQGIVALTTELPIRKKCFDPERSPFIVMIDRVQDPRNLGAIIRSAYCVGADGIVIPQKGCAPISSTVLKASAGLAEHCEIWQPATGYAAAQELKQAGYNLYVAALGGTDATTVNYNKPLCAIIGNEATGVSREIMRLSTTVTLPQREPDISYNASVAAGILLFTIAQKIK